MGRQEFGRVFTKVKRTQLFDHLTWNMSTKLHSTTWTFLKDSHGTLVTKFINYATKTQAL